MKDQDPIELDSRSKRLEVAVWIAVFIGVWAGLYTLHPRQDQLAGHPIEDFLVRAIMITVGGMILVSLDSFRWWDWGRIKPGAGEARAHFIVKAGAILFCYWLIAMGVWGDTSWMKSP